jgi:hypothetical protein
VRLPKNLYARIVTSSTEPYVQAADGLDGLSIEVGDKTKVGLYKLIGVYDAEGVISTSKIKLEKGKR